MFYQKTRLQRYRERHSRSRLDYYPAADVLAIVRHHYTLGMDPTVAGVIDALIRAGHRSVFGNGKI